MRTKIKFKKFQIQTANSYLDMKKMTDLAQLFLMISIAVITRIIPHAPNFTAIGALAIVAGSFYGFNIKSISLPLLALIMSDVVLGFHSTMVFVYASFVLIALISSITSTSGKNLGIKSCIMNSVISSVVFFIISNLGVWLVGNLYPLHFKGLVECFVMAIPFFKYEFLGTLIYLGAFTFFSKFSVHFFNRVFLKFLKIQ